MQIKILKQIAKIRSEKNIPYIIGCESRQSEKEILQRASDFYGVKMITIERRSNVIKH